MGIACPLGEPDLSTALSFRLATQMTSKNLTVGTPAWLQLRKKERKPPAQEPLISCPASSCRALVSSRDPASKGMSAWWFPVFGEVLCGLGSVYIHELGCYHLAAAVETAAGRVLGWKEEAP